MEKRPVSDLSTFQGHKLQMNYFQPIKIKGIIIIPLILIG